MKIEGPQRDSNPQPLTHMYNKRLSNRIYKHCRLRSGTFINVVGMYFGQLKPDKTRF